MIDERAAGRRARPRMDRARDDLRAVLPAWVTARLLVGAAFVVAVAVADELAPGARPEQLDEGLLSWDGAFYREIAARGYGPLDDAALRFFPLFPVLGRLLAPVGGGAHGAALVVLANLSAVVLGVLVRRLVLYETGDAALADRSVWLTMLVPPAFVLVFAYSEALFLVLAVGMFLALRRSQWVPAGLLGAAAALTRPFGLFLVLPALVEVWRRRGSGLGLPALAPIVGPLLGTGAYLLYTGAAFGTWTGPYDTQSDFRGDLVDPVTRLVRGIGDLAGEETFGDGLHLPFAVFALVMVFLTFRYWPVSYGVFAAVIVLGAVSADNLNSLERYTLDAFPVVLTLAVLVSSPRMERLALALCGGGLLALTSLALLGAYVP